MARPLRIEYEGAWYHVLNRGRRKEKIFFDDYDRECFFRILDEASKLFALEVHAYSLMPNHYHILVRTPLGNLSRIMRHINGVYTQYINRRYKYEGTLFRGRFKSILVEQESYLLELLRYIHRNPKKAKIEKTLGTHKWTSHRAYMRKQERPSWLVVNKVLERFGNHEKSALKELDLFVKKLPSRELEQRLDSFKWPSILGGDIFKEKMNDLMLGKKLDFSEIPQAYDCLKKITAQELLSEIAKKYNLKEEELCTKRSRMQRNYYLKRAFVYVSRNFLHLKSREIANAIGGVSRTIITNQYSAAVKDIKNKEGCCKDVVAIEKMLNKMLKLQVET